MKLLRQMMLACVFTGILVLVSHAQDTATPATDAKPPEQDTTTPATDAKPPAKDLVLTGDAKCTRCHDESEAKPVLSIYQTRHGVKADTRTPTCQSCHGASEDHVKNTAGTATRPAPEVLFGARSGKDSSFGRSPTEMQNASCLECHQNNFSRTHWDGSAHQVGDVACVSCHEIHTAHDKVRDKRAQPDICFTCHKEQRAESRKISHHAIGEGKVACSDCHNPHGSAGSKLLKKNTVNETCFTCHAEKRGPFLWEHQPVTEDCTTCHTPHGSNITPLLKSRAPFLCSECHDGPHNSKVPAVGNVAGTQGGLTSVPSENYTGRACQNCHSMVHGSNHPAGALLHR
jgi:DmsE family decaheme c-type cytochrome